MSIIRKNDMQHRCFLAGCKDSEKMDTGIVLLNLGGPDSLKAVRPFLYNLFSDREIIRLGPSFLQKPIAWMISTSRAGHTRAMYSKIGSKSPILEITKLQAAELEKALNKGPGFKDQRQEDKTDTPLSPSSVRGETEGLKFKCYIGMRYWHPLMEETVQEILKDRISRLIVLSLYPHYSKATTGSSMDDFKRAITGKNFDVQYIEQWFDFPPYIDALARLIYESVSVVSSDDFHLLYSAHSLPQSFIDEGDPYLDHINATIEKVNIRLSEPPYNVSNLKWHLSFQSKTGPVKWLEPSTEETIVELGKKGCRYLIVVPISFVSDHIETLYEIDILYKDLAAQHGITLRRCQSLNTSEKFISALRELVITHLK
jgi:ferrochelatase